MQQKYKVLSEISYAARSWNPGEVVEMPPDRAEKYLQAKQIEAVKAVKQNEGGNE